MLHGNHRLAPGFLIASPRLDDSAFERAVIMMVHHDEEGALGFILNKPLEVDLGSLLVNSEEDIAREDVPESCFESIVHFGGPVRTEQLWLIFEDPEPKYPVTQMSDFETYGQLHFGERWCLVADSDSIEDFIYERRTAPYRPYIGYTGWGPGQLEEEIEQGSWLFLEFRDEFVLHATAHENESVLWNACLKSLGVDPMAFMMMGGVGSA